MSTVEPPADWPVLHRDDAGRLHAQAEELPDLPAVMAHAGRLAGLTVTRTDEGPWLPGRVGRQWTLEFRYRDHDFTIHTNYHAAVTIYSAGQPDCPEGLLREVVAHFEETPHLAPTWQPPPPLTARRLLLFVLVALAVAVPLVLFLAFFRKQ